MARAGAAGLCRVLHAQPSRTQTGHSARTPPSWPLAATLSAGAPGRNGDGALGLEHSRIVALACWGLTGSSIPDGFIDLFIMLCPFFVHVFSVNRL